MGEDVDHAETAIVRVVAMGDGGTATLIFYKKGNWRSEHPLNTLAAWATRSDFSHVELAIGEESGTGGQMCNVLRVFNDDVGTELTQRTGKNPSVVYLQLGCTKTAELAMLEFARNQIGKPFSLSGMARSIIWPRETRGDTYFCAGMPPICQHIMHVGILTFRPTPFVLPSAELVAATLQTGGIMCAYAPSHPSDGPYYQ